MKTNKRSCAPFKRMDRLRQSKQVGQIKPTRHETRLLPPQLSLKIFCWPSTGVHTYWIQPPKKRRATRLNTRQKKSNIEEVPSDGQCLFNAIDQTKVQAPQAHPLRTKVVEWIRQNWNKNPDMAEMMPHLAKGGAAVANLGLQDVFDDIKTEETLEEYLETMSRASTYATEAEAAIGAYLGGYRVAIYTTGANGTVQMERAMIGDPNGEARSILLSNRDKGQEAHYDIYRPLVDEWDRRAKEGKAL